MIMNTINRDMLVWFQHIHKAAGSAIMNIAQQNGVKFYPVNYNGNPVYPDLNSVEARMSISKYNTKEIRYDRYDENELIQFVDQNIQDGVELISCEWGFPQNMLLDDRIYYITCLRNPFDRMISNYSYDKKNFPHLYHTVDDWANGTPLFTRDNYYTLILAGLDKDFDGPVTSKEYEQALNHLYHFNLVLVLEDSKCFDILSIVTGWAHNNQIVNKTATKETLDDDYHIDYQERNKYDYMLYDHAQRIMNSHLGKFNIGRIELSLQHDLNSMEVAEQYPKVYNVCRELDNRGMKETAMFIYLFILNRMHVHTLRKVSDQLEHIVKPNDDGRIRNNVFGIVKIDTHILLAMLYHISYMGYYTSYKQISCDICNVLINTHIDHPYTQRCINVMSYYHSCNIQPHDMMS